MQMSGQILCHMEDCSTRESWKEGTNRNTVERMHGLVNNFQHFEVYIEHYYQHGAEPDHPSNL